MAKQFREGTSVGPCTTPHAFHTTTTTTPPTPCLPALLHVVWLPTQSPTVHTISTEGHARRWRGWRVWHHHPASLYKYGWGLPLGLSRFTSAGLLCVISTAPRLPSPLATMSSGEWHKSEAKKHKCRILSSVKCNIISVMECFFFLLWSALPVSLTDSCFQYRVCSTSVTYTNRR